MTNSHLVTRLAPVSLVLVDAAVLAAVVYLGTVGNAGDGPGIVPLTPSGGPVEEVQA
ncbi:hypothetical protein BH23CHL4_BH23CHL4_30400 [soil metagenome]